MTSSSDLTSFSLTKTIGTIGNVNWDVLAKTPDKKQPFVTCGAPSVDVHRTAFLPVLQVSYPPATQLFMFFTLFPMGNNLPPSGSNLIVSTTTVDAPASDSLYSDAEDTPSQSTLAPIHKDGILENDLPSAVLGESIHQDR